MQKLDIFAWKQQWRNGFLWGGLLGWTAGILIACLAAATTPDKGNPAYQRGKTDGLREAEQIIQPQVKDGTK